ncbi:lectin MOA-related protein [Xenorhabdus innexi]|uniref:Agglutinin C-terminal domain-containing protein n=1 Tax=Xenorhabdus innexi TaxID=290109 RepID=A0A1N6MZZ2_9GAMM|nr:lectin MOA-related protein [Xenorhabdus innexi]PHM37818.1 hypothetical protein Xinn_00624 [Xenorhabdus innexi]SIP74354.1 hypothetical protein XIS1_600120 [Xenorhabdus innexi]
MDKPDSAYKRYAYFGSEKDYQQYVIPIQFSASPQYDESYVFGINDEVEDVVYLYDITMSIFGVYLYFDYYNSDPYFKEVKLTAEYIKTVKDQSQYKLIMNNKERHMFLYCPETSSSSWDWLQLNSNNFTLMSFYPLHFENSIVKKRCKGVWSSRVPIKTSDSACTPVSDEIAKKLYQDAKLGSYERRVESFNYEDFCHVYKAQVSKTAYKNDVEIAYCFILMWGKQQNDKNAVIAFLAISP